MAGWRDYLSVTDTVMQNVHAVHACNWDKTVSSLHSMLPCMIVNNMEDAA